MDEDDLECHSVTLTEPVSLAQNHPLSTLLARNNVTFKLASGCGLKKQRSVPFHFVT